MAMQKRGREKEKKKKDGFLRNSKANIAGSIIDLPLRDYPCIVSVCRSSVSSSQPPTPPSPRLRRRNGSAKKRGAEGEAHTVVDEL